jgi:AhpD family alkylhydroperoxidase
METRFDVANVPDALKAMYALEGYIQKESGIPRNLIHLIKLRASIINGCAYCVDMHVKESRHDKLPEQWINLVSVWEEAHVYSPVERAVLRWTDSLTLISKTKAPDEDYAELRKYFSEADCTRITVAIGAINIWNRLAVGGRKAHPIDKTA